ncbi:hypothetical protein ACN20G_30820 (plasmid) [Streptomyces sp. BI20]|uniref:hypothetical protein n=1 Tax=Streptomyces sp. BI20 TaxID=3403460 RepID=UPI003C72B12D
MTPRPVSRALRRTAPLTALMVLAAGLLGCAPAAGPAGPSGPDPVDATIRAATVRLTDACLRERGLTPPVARPSAAAAAPPEDARVTWALFGAGPAELSLTLAGGQTVRAHTDGCLAGAQRRLYGDEAAWFRASVVVNNLDAQAVTGTGRDPAAAHAEAVARHRPEIEAHAALRARAYREARDLLSTPSAAVGPS